MFEKFARSWSLVKASAAVLRADKELLWFPVISSIAALLVAATFLVPSFLSGLFDGGAGPASIVVGFLFYVTQFTVKGGLPEKRISDGIDELIFCPSIAKRWNRV